MSANLTNFKAIFYCKSTARHNIMRVADEHVTLGQIIMNSLFPLLYYVLFVIAKNGQDLIHIYIYTYLLGIVHFTKDTLGHLMPNLYI